MKNDEINAILAKLIGKEGYTHEKYWPVADDDDYCIRSVPKDFCSDWNNLMKAWMMSNDLLLEGREDSIKHYILSRDCKSAATAIAEAIKENKS